MLEAYAPPVHNVLMVLPFKQGLGLYTSDTVLWSTSTRLVSQPWTHLCGEFVRASAVGSTATVTLQGLKKKKKSGNLSGKEPSHTTAFIASGY